MLLALMVYLAEILPKVSEYLSVIAFISGVIILIMYVGYLLLTERVPPMRFLKWLWVPVLTGMLSALMPSERTVYMAVGAYGVQTLAETESVQKLGSNGVDMLNQLIERAKRETMSDLVPKDEKQKEKVQVDTKGTKT